MVGHQYVSKYSTWGVTQKACGSKTYFCDSNSPYMCLFCFAESWVATSVGSGTSSFAPIQGCALRLAFCWWLLVWVYLSVSCLIQAVAVYAPATSTGALGLTKHFLDEFYLALIQYSMCLRGWHSCKMSNYQSEGPGFNPVPGQALYFGQPSFTMPSADRDIKLPM